MRRLPDDFPSVEDQALPWPVKPEDPTEDERRSFTRARLELESFIKRDFDKRMTPTVKLVASFLLECVNSETLLCFPSYRTILESVSIGSSEKTVQRAIAVLRERGWLYSWRLDRNSSNRFIFLRNEAVVSQILDYQDSMKQRREEDRQEREQTQMSGRKPPKRTPKSVREQTQMSGKSFNTIHEPFSGIEEEVSIKGSSPYAVARADDDDLAFPVPTTDEEAAQMMADICFGHDPTPGIKNFLLGCLETGTLSRSRAERILKPEARREAA